MKAVSDNKFEELFRHKRPINYGVVTEEPFADYWGGAKYLHVVYELWCADISGKITMKVVYRYPVSKEGINNLKRLFALHGMDVSFLDTLNEQIHFEIEHGNVIPYRSQYCFEEAI